MSKVELTIDGAKIQAPPGTLVVEAAKLAGIAIPVFCHHERLKPVGACRMCLVEVEKSPRLQTSCTMPVAAGMVIKTQTSAVLEARQAVLEMLLANHPLDCPICDKGGECPLQDNAFQHGSGTSRLSEPKRAKAKALPLSPLIALDRERCILCYRCTRFQDEIAGDGALVALDRGGESEIGTHDGESFDSPFSGNTVELCPVGALTSRQYRFRARPWDLQATESVCSGCSVGCNVRLDARDGSLLRVLSRPNARIDDGWLCDTGRYATLPMPLGAAHAAASAIQGPATLTPATQASAAHSPSARARWPLVREGGQLQRTTLDRALARALELLRSARSAVLLPGRLTNEALRLVAGDLPSALPGTAIGFAEPIVSAWPVVGRIANLAACRKIVDIGCDPWRSLPVLALWLRKATTSGAGLVVLGPHNGLAHSTTHWLRAADGALAAAAEDLAAALAGSAASPAATAAAASLRQAGPAAVLLGGALASDRRVLQAAQRIAAALGVDAATGFCGAPLRGLNARGAAELAPQLAGTDPLAGRPEVVFSLGCDVPVLVPGGRAIVATSGAVPTDAAVDVVLPLAHPYETDGHVTNLEGTEQLLRAVRHGRSEIRMDHELVRELLRAAAAPSGRP